MITALSEYTPVAVAYKMSRRAIDPYRVRSNWAPNMTFQKKPGTIQRPKITTPTMRTTSKREVNRTDLPARSPVRDAADTGNMVLTTDQAHMFTKRPTSATAA